ncbi:hypothetical protein PoB_003942800 [Plakobranchus ocellatus]|uniref:Uncharacterized protein n=1 Tax=Plakobranchus ocellatus TaxID=259542 RepID=A0AAV4B037_9GAST|nr:hypothetical protein PoB_003942800 [Plakobranchus ocellatus]
MIVDTFNYILVKIEPRKSKNFVTGRGMPRNLQQGDLRLSGPPTGQDTLPPKHTIPRGIVQRIRGRSWLRVRWEDNIKAWIDLKVRDSHKAAENRVGERLSKDPQWCPKDSPLSHRIDEGEGKCLL